MIAGNKGEWSELYVLLYLLGAGRLYAANEQAEKLKDIYFPIIKIIRDDAKKRVDYLIKDETLIEIYLNNAKAATYKSEEFQKEAALLYKKIIEGQDRAFSIPETEEFMSKIYTDRLAAPSTDKTDITLQVHDIHTGYEPVMGFSIKSEIGNAPTLLNASGSTNFVYEVTGLSDKDIEDINKINTSKKILDRMQEIRKRGGSITYRKTNNPTFSMNLMLIDSKMEDMIAQMLLHSYSTGESDCLELMKNLDTENPLKFPRTGFYTYKYKKFLAAIALGMKPADLWDGLDEANGGYIIVKSSGDVLAYHLYNRNFFEQYLLDNTKLERPSTTRHKYASLYKEDNHIYINLNLQIRFK